MTELMRMVERKATKKVSLRQIKRRPDGRWRWRLTLLSLPTPQVLRRMPFAS